MVSWEKSFAAAFKVIVYSLLWWVAGVIIILIGLGMMGTVIILDVLTTGKIPNFTNILAVLIGFIVMAIGYIIALVGTLASFMKVFTELIVKEINEPKDNKNIPIAEHNRSEEPAKKWFHIGVDLASEADMDGALEAYKKALEIKRDYADAWFRRACIFSIKGEREKALFDLKKAIEIDNSNKEEAKKEKDFKNLWSDKDFKKLVE